MSAFLSGGEGPFADVTGTSEERAAPAPAPAALTLSYRPIRSVISIRADDLALFRHVIRHCTRVWGGALNFIAVEEEAGRWDEFTVECIERADLDFLTVLGPDANERSALLHRVRHLPPERRQLGGADIAPAFAPRDTPIGTQMIELPSGEDLPDVYAAAWGEIATSPGRERSLGYAGHFLSQWGANSESPLAQSIAGIGTFGHWEMVADAVLTLVPIPTPKALRELAQFWNLRASLWPLGDANGIGVLPLWDIEWQGPRFRTIVRRWVMRRGDERPRINIIDGPYTAQARAIAEDLLLREDVDTDDPTIARYVHVPLELTIGKPELPPHRVRISGYSAVQLPFHYPDGIAATLASPIALDGWCVVDVLGEPRFYLPARPEMGRLVHERGRSLGDGVAVGIRPSRERAVELRLPTDEQVVRTLISGAGLRYERSEAGRQTDQLLMALEGDLTRLVLRDRAVVGVVRLLAPHRESRLAEADAAALPAKSLTLEQLRDRLPTMQQGQVWRAVSELVRARVLLGGLRVQCPTCGLREWRVVDDVATRMTCRGCLGAVRFDATEPGVASEPRWAYRINESFAGLFSQGTAAVAIALARLREDARHSFRYVPGLSVEGLLSDDVEIDALACVDSLVAVLEAKSSGHLDEASVSRTVAAAVRLDAIAYFATIEQWDESSRATLAAAANGSGRVRSLEGSDLMP